MIFGLHARETLLSKNDTWHIGFSAPVAAWNLCKGGGRVPGVERGRADRLTGR